MSARAPLAALAALMLAGGLATPAAAAEATAIFASGCFWCTEADFEKLPGVIGAESGYIGGRTENPSYEQVSAGATGHAEAVRLRYDPERVSYERLLAHYWRNVDPTVKDRQFCDQGTQYRSAIFYLDEAQRKAAEASRDALLASGRFERIHTEIVAASTFWPAEEYHQDYYKKNPLRYGYYRHTCGRDARLEALWGKE
jgi:peptide-methionine (S)-S-oxide reductase